MADIFISYSSEDKSLVRYLVDLLEQKGWSVWWDRQIPIGQRYDEVIEKQLTDARCVLVVWTQRSVTSEWVRNEASEADAKGKLVPIVLENVTVPLNFRRIESARLKGWQGEPDHPELQVLYQSIEQILHAVPGAGQGTISAGKPSDYKFFYRNTRTTYYVILLAIALVLAGTAWYARIPPKSSNVTFRVVDWKKNPITQGEVKVYLNEYVRVQSIDNMGQALLSGIPINILNQKVKIDASSPGYVTMHLDTLIKVGKPLDITLPLMTRVVISGRIKTAAEMPIKGVEVNVDGTRYYTISITDGSYVLHLDEYTLGDEISMTTSHKNYEDKTVHLRIVAPEINNEDIFLNPIHH